jgi:hypothetical protein
LFYYYFVGCIAMTKRASILGTVTPSTSWAVFLSNHKASKTPKQESAIKGSANMSRAMKGTSVATVTDMAWEAYLIDMDPDTPDLGVLSQERRNKFQEGDSPNKCRHTLIRKTQWLQIHGKPLCRRVLV